MMTDDFTQLVVPQPAQISINPTAKECPSDGFNYPKFRQLNKQERVKLSTKPYQHQPNVLYLLFAVANSKGWFAAATLQEDGTHSLVFSQLADLRAAFKNAKAGNGTFTPQRTIQLNSQKPTIFVFANNDTRLFVAFEGGELLVYDTAVLFSAGNDSVNPIYALPSNRGPIRVLAPNPGPEPNLLDLLAVVYSDNTVVLYNMKLEAQGGWSSTSGNAPVAAAWSPKGKHIAIGLQSGDILTYPLTNKSSIHKHIPPTHQSPLASLDWLTPGHTFRTSYGGQGIDPVQHIICVDSKAPTATYYAPNFPFPASDRSNQSYILALQKWDEGAGATESKSLVVVADKASVDIEILGSIGTQWYQESQENPLSLPLNDDQGDTLLLGLAVDLTDEQTGEPVMYAYLDDGTIQAWHLEHSKPYSGMITSQTATAATPASSTTTQPTTPIPVISASPQVPSAFGQTSTPISAFGKPSAFGAQAAPAFGTTGFGQKTTSMAFGQPSPFGQASSSSVFGTPPAFGQTSQPTNAFNSLQTQSSAFGQSTNPSVFGAGSGAFGSGSSSAFSGGSTGAFGGGSSSGGASSGSAVGGTTSSNVFGGPSFGATASSNAFGGGNSFASLANNASVPNVFGQGGFETPSSSLSSMFAPQMTREESVSMSDDTPSLGGMGLGAPNDSSLPAKSGGIFGSFATSAVSSTTPTSAFGLIKPASGAFSNFSTNTNPPTDPKPTTESVPVSAFGNAIKPASGFGQPSFGGPSFGQQAAFGQSSFGKPAAIQPTSVVGGGFGAFASSTPSSFAAVTQQTGTPVSGGFSAFASSAASPFGTAASTTLPASGSFSAAAGTGAFGTASAFGTSGFSASPVAKSPSEMKVEALESPPTRASVKPSILAESPPSSPDATPRLGKVSVDDKSPAPSTDITSTTPVSSPFGKVPGPSPGAFANLVTTPSVFKPATGFGAFGSDKTPTSSPFFNTSADTKSTFTSGLPTAFAGSPSSAGALSTSTSPAFGSASALGAARSAFPVISAGSPTPAKAPATGGFGAFSGAPSGFGVSSGPKMSFDELLKVGDNDTKGPVKPSTSKSAEAEESKPVSVFPVVNKDAPAPVSTPPKESLEREDTLPSLSDGTKGKGLEKGDLSDEPSFVNLSTISVGSSFTEANGEEPDEQDVRSDGEDAEGGFLSDDLEVEEGETEDEEDEESSESEEEPSQLSDVPEEDEEEEGEEEGEEEEEEKEEAESSQNKDAVPDPASVPLPQSRSPSSTPQPEVPKVKVTPSPPPETLSEKIHEGSTTPPGTPPKEVTPPPTRPVPVSVPSPAPSTPFGLNLGRPSTRPTRSSPLASSAVSLADDDETPPSPAKPLVSPQPRIETLATKDGSDDDAASSIKPPRPRTPPLLSAFGSSKPAATNATPVTPPISAVQTSSTTSETPAPLPTLGLFGKPNAAPQPITSVVPVSSSSGLFGNLTAKTDTPITQSPLLSQGPGPVAGSSAPSGFFGKTFSLPSSAAVEKGKGKEGETSLLGPLPPSSKANESTSGTVPPPIDLSTFKAKPVTSSTSAPVTPPPFNLSGFSLKPPASATTATTSGLSAPVSLPVLATPEKPPINIPTEAGLQRECMLVYSAVSEDLTALRVIAEQRTKGLGTIQARGNMPRTRADIADPREWSPASSSQFGRILLQFEKDLDELHDIRIAQRTQLKEIQSNVLKAKTRKEGIGRFNRAKDDKEFAKMLKARSLGPEHLETQVQLRRAIRAIRDRVQSLEDHLKGSKKKLTQVKTGRPSIRPPSLDSINRTYRNIDLALSQQSAKIALLKKRFAKLRSSQSSMSDPSSPSPYLKRDPRLPSPQSKHRLAVTPDVAATTAAALNAERAAHRLKRALLQARSAPLLNTTASLAPAPPLSFNTPQKEVRPTWTPPERRGATGAKKHGVVPFAKKTGSPASHGGVYSGNASTASPSFDWGPLPSFDYEKKGSSISITPLR